MTYTIENTTSGFVTIQTTEVMNRWSKKFKNHSMGIDAKIENVEAL